MFTLSQTYEGLKVTVHYFIELAKFLIMQKVSHLLTESFFQDLLGKYFGKKRSSGVRKYYPSLYDFDYNENTIRNQKVFKSISTGNVSVNM